MIVHSQKIIEGQKSYWLNCKPLELCYRNAKIGWILKLRISKIPSMFGDLLSILSMNRTSKGISTSTESKKKFWIPINIWQLRWFRSKICRIGLRNWWLRWVCCLLWISMRIYSFCKEEVQTLCMKALMIKRRVQCLRVSV